MLGANQGLPSLKVTSLPKLQPKLAINGFKPPPTWLDPDEETFNMESIASKSKEEH